MGSKTSKFIWEAGLVALVAILFVFLLADPSEFWDEPGAKPLDADLALHVRD